jgi:hypothetical protein
LTNRQEGSSPFGTQFALVAPSHLTYRDQNRIQEICAGLVHEDKGSQVTNVNVIAWAIKCENAYFPAYLIEEVLVLAERVHEGSGSFSNRWILAHLGRFPNSAGERWRLWETGVGSPALAVMEHYPALPSENAIVEFVRRTNFGNNDFRTHSGEYHIWSRLEVLKVILYRKCDQLAVLLKDGLSDAEKQRREEEALSLISPSP